MSVRKTPTRRPHGDGTVFYDERRQRWVGSVELEPGPDGKRRRSKVSGKTEREAATKLRELRKRVDDGHDVTARTMTVEQLLLTWLADVAPDRQSAKTLQVTRSLVTRQLIPVVGALRVTALRPEHVERLLRDAAGCGAARSTLRRLKHVLTAACQWAQSRRVITWNPAKLALMPPLSATKPPRVQRALDEAEQVRLLNAASGHRLHAWVALAVTNGLRPGELGALSWSAVSLDDGMLTVDAALKWTPDGTVVGETKTRKPRTLSLSPELVELLRQHRRQQAVERSEHGGWPAEWAGLVFTTTHGTPVDARNVRPQLDGIAKRAGLGHVSPYALRHSACSLMCADGVALERVADVLGHTDTQMVSRHYRHQLGPSITAAVATSSRLLRATGTT
jgi:integrase